MEALVSYLGDMSLIQLEIDTHNEKQIQKGMDLIMKHLIGPFEDLECKYLLMLKYLLNIPKMLVLLCKNTDSIDYLVRKHSGNKDIFDLKNEVRGMVLIKLEVEAAKKGDEFFLTYLNYFKAAAHTNKITQMETLTEAN